MYVLQIDVQSIFCFDFSIFLFFFCMIIHILGWFLDSAIFCHSEFELCNCRIVQKIHSIPYIPLILLN